MERNLLRLMIAGWRITLALAAMTTSFAPAASIPTCITHLQESESGGRPFVAAPTVTPAGGMSGANVTIAGSGFAPRAHLVVAAVYGERGCSIVGLGDQFLGTVEADARGRYSLSIGWPSVFDPVLGREKIPSTPLPAGRYYLIAMPCSARAACSFADGSRPGGPFLLSGTTGTAPVPTPRGDPPGRAPAGPLAIAATLSLGVALALGWLWVRHAGARGPMK
ncbi:MAG: hypothetical protein ACXVES_13825 [Actinomycetota bacterium]